MVLRNLLILIQLFFTLSAFAGEFVSSVEDFYEHTRLHRERVKLLGVELFKSHPDLFNGLTLEQVQGVLSMHDEAKVTTFYRVLYENYGGPVEKSIVDALNAKDKEFMDQALKKFGIEKESDLLLKMSRIEKIADMVDRGMSPVTPEEFGRPMKKASEFIGGILDRQLALDLESRYQSIVGNLKYRKPDALRRQAIAHQLKAECFQRSFLTLKARSYDL